MDQEDTNLQAWVTEHTHFLAVSEYYTWLLLSVRYNPIMPDRYTVFSLTLPHARHTKAEPMLVPCKVPCHNTQPRDQLQSYLHFLINTFNMTAVRSFIWIKINVIVAAINCPEVYAPEYGSVDVKGYSHSSRAEYSCNHGYYLYGDRYITCDYGIWKGKTPICKRKSVDIPNKPPLFRKEARFGTSIVEKSLQYQQHIQIRLSIARS